MSTTKLTLLLFAAVNASWIRVGNTTWPARHASGTPDAPAEPLALVWGASGCVLMPTGIAKLAGPFALLVERGACTFDAKMTTAAQVDASALFVVDSWEGEYASGGNLSVPASEMRLSDPCGVDCDLGRGTVSTAGLDAAAVLHDALAGQCGGAHECPSQSCAFSGSGLGKAKREICCLVGQTIDMALPGHVVNHTALPAFFLALTDGAALASLAWRVPGAPAAAAGSQPRRATIFEDAAPPDWDWSALVVLVLGTTTAAVASHLAAEHHLAEDRRRRKAAAAVGGHDEVEESDEVLSMTVGMSVGFLLTASAFLLALFLLIRAGYGFVMHLLILLFVVASATSLITVVLHPTLRRVPALRSRTARLVPAGVWRGGSSSCVGDFCTTVSHPHELALHLATACGIAVALTWYLNRGARWAWAAQDVLATAIICSFLRTVRLPSLRVASLLLGMMCAYDIFMVFVSPLIFHSSIMMTVATAGEATAQVSGKLGVCIRTPEEHMPMLLLVPRLGSPPLPAGAMPPPSDGQAFAMLGLGDVVLPGLLLVLARRLDLFARARAGGGDAHRDGGGRGGQGGGGSGGGGCGASCVGGGYFAASVLAYAAGLSMALAANSLHLTVNGVQGQPALLYLVPCTLGAVWWRGWRRGELRALWHGTVLDPPADAVAADDLSGRDGGNSPCSSEPHTESEPGDYKPLL